MTSKRNYILYEILYFQQAKINVIYDFNLKAHLFFSLSVASCTSWSKMPSTSDPPSSDPPSSHSSLASSRRVAPSKTKTKKKPQPSVLDVRTDSQFTALSSLSAAQSDCQSSRASSKSYPPSVTQRETHSSVWSPKLCRSTQSKDLYNSQDSYTSTHSSTTSSVSARTLTVPDTSSHHDGHVKNTLGSKEAPTPLYILEPGTFDILLCVDSCETSGG